MNLKQILQWYNSIEALSYLTTMIFGAVIGGFGLSTILFTYTTNSYELMKLLWILTFCLIPHIYFRIEICIFNYENPITNICFINSSILY